jgi:hypothetical protein
MTPDADVVAALAVLADVKARCHSEDMRTPAIFAALDWLERRATVRAGRESLCALVS